MVTPRLQCIINHIHGNVVADIGTDHAYVPVRLIDEGRAETVIASDICKGPVDSAMHTVEKFNMTEKIDVRLGTGVSTLCENEADTIIIAGMGGILIRDIIKDGLSIIKNATLVLQPMNCQYELRKYLIENDFIITDEDIAIEGFKVYNLLIVKKGHAAPFLKDVYYHIPPYLKNHKYFNMLYEKKNREFTKVITGLENSTETDVEKLEMYRKWQNDLHIMKEEV